MASEAMELAVVPTLVKGVTLHRLPQKYDARGGLSFCEISRHVPFEMRRYFLLYGVADQAPRGAHAHRTLDQFMTCVHGRCTILADDGENRQEFILESPAVGLHIPPMTWSTQHLDSPATVLLVLASHPYDEHDYIREYDEFRALV